MVALSPRGWLRAAETSWPALAASLLAFSLVRAAQPSSWRRPVSDAFWSALGFATLGSAVAIVVAAGVIGVGVVAQALVWLEDLGEADAVRSTLLRVLIREVAPVTIGLVLLGRSGLIQLTEMARLRDDGTLRVLQAEGMDPGLLLAMPLILAFGIAAFCNAVAFTLLTMAVGYGGAALLGLSVLGPGELAVSVSRDLGATGVLILPLKSFVIGLVIGAIVSATALQPARQDRRLVLPRGFFRCLTALFVVSATLSLML